MANPIMASSTGTIITSNGSDMVPAQARALFVFWNLLPTRSYKLRLIVLLAFALLFRGGRQERLRKIEHFHLLVGRERAHQMRSNHNQQFVVAFLLAPALEQLAQNGNIAQAGNFIDGFDDRVIDQPGNRKTFAVFQHYFGFGAALREGGDGEAFERNGIGVIERAHLRRNFQIDGAECRNRRSEIQLHAERFELHRDHRGGCASGGRRRDRGIRERAAGEEARLFSIERDEVRLRQNLQQVILLQRLDGGADVQVRPEGEEVQQIRKVDAGGRAALDRAETRRVELLRGQRALQFVVGAEQIEADLLQRHAIQSREFHLQKHL